jgi:hypothetical protein
MQLRNGKIEITEYLERTVVKKDREAVDRRLGEQH